MQTVELDRLDLKYEGCRLQDRQLERRLLSSLAERGQEDPIEGVFLSSGQFLVLNGFKRIRSLRLMGRTQIEYRELGADEVEGIFCILSIDQKRSLHILEQAQWMQELRAKHKLSISDIAHKLERSPAWVSIRISLIQEITPEIRREIFSGKFPARAYMYSVRHFTRVKRVPPQEVEDFVKAVSGKNLSGRHIECLARGYFEGGEGFRQQLKHGNLNLCLDKMNHVVNSREDPSGDLNDLERRCLKDLRFSQTVMEQLTHPKNQQGKLESPVFFAEAELLSSGVLRRIPHFQEAMQKLYDQCRNTKSGMGVISKGPAQEANCNPP